MCGTKIGGRGLCDTISWKKCVILNLGVVCRTQCGGGIRGEESVAPIVEGEWDVKSGSSVWQSERDTSVVQRVR